MRYILALDQGTTSSRAIVFDAEGKVRGVGQKEFGQIFPRNGWVEHDANEIWSTQIGVAQEALANAGIRADDGATLENESDAFFGGWGYARWLGADQKPYGKDAGFVQECVGCHTPVKDRDWVFTHPVKLP